MGFRFPAPSSRTLLGDASAIAAQLTKLVADRTLQEGWVVSETLGAQRFLFVAGGKPYSSGAIDDRTLDPAPAELAAFFRTLPSAGKVELVLAPVELFLCVVLPFRKAPSSQVTAGSIDPASIESTISETASDCVLSIRRGSAFSFALFRKGKLERLFPCDGETFPRAETLADGLAAYGKQNPNASIDVYDDLELAPALGAGGTFESYAARAAQPRTSPPASLVVKLGGRSVFRFEVPDAGATIGRGPDCDLRLDNLSVSRLHARVRKIAGLIAIEDAGSENGILAKGAKVARAQLAQGEEVEIGRYSIMHAIPGTSAERLSTTQLPVSPATAALDTVQTSGDATPAAAIVHDGQPYKIRGFAFVIGGGLDANLRIPGFLVGTPQVRILKDPKNGSHSATRDGGKSAPLLNGKPLESATLADGDVITIGKHAFTFKARA